MPLDSPRAHLSCWYLLHTKTEMCFTIIECYTTPESHCVLCGILFHRLLHLVLGVGCSKHKSIYIYFFKLATENTVVTPGASVIVSERPASGGGVEQRETSWGAPRCASVPGKRRLMGTRVSVRRILKLQLQKEELQQDPRWQTVFTVSLTHILYWCDEAVYRCSSSRVNCYSGSVHCGSKRCCSTAWPPEDGRGQTIHALR